MIELLFLLTILLLQVQGTTWPTTKLIHPPSGILIEGAGRATNITFDVSGVPFPEERKWYKDGAEITTFNNMNVDESGGNLISLKFNALSKVNEGVYYFVVRESKNTLEASKSLEVRLKVSFLDDFQDSAETQTKTAQVGEFARLECRAPAHFGAYPKFSWSKGAEKIVESDSIYVSEYGDLIIMQVAFEQYSSDYRCTIKIDSLMEGEQEKQGPAVSLIVTGNAASYVPPNIALQPIDLKIDAQVKETFRVECAVNGYPTLPSIRWYKDSVQIGSSGIIYDLQNRNFLKISIPRSGGSVGGTYRCEANDGTKQIYASAEIEIQTKPIITTGLPTAEVKKSSGSTMDLSCEATSTPTPQYKWYKNANLLTNDNLNHAINGGNLSISNINSLNRGVYQCEAFNDIGSTISTGMIRVQERLTFVIRPKDVEAFLGTAATFNCQGKGDPKPTSLRWEFNGGTPPATHDYTNNLVNQATYKIPKVTSSERDGRVSCIISSPTNLYPEDTATAIVTIREGPQVKATQKNITANEGEQRDLTCMVENVGNSVNWKWLFKDTLITQDDDRRITVEHNMIEIRALTGADQGTYTCQADENGLSNSDTMFIMVKTMPRITLDDTLRIGEGADARLTCKVTSNPTPVISWIRNGQTINNSAKFTIDQPNDGTSILVVSSVDKATDIGKYACKATNELATKQSEIDLVVVAACEVMDIPKDAEADYQTTVTVSCTVNACPTAQWTWMKDGQLINFDGSRTIDRGSSIELRQVVPTDGGEYSCTVDSNNGLDNRGTYSATITVTVKAKIYGFPESKVLFKGGDTVKMDCSAHGDDSQGSLLVEWYKSGVRQNTGSSVIQKDTTERISFVTSTLLINSAIASDAGHYQCIAQNGVSVDKRDTSLMLMTYPDRPGQPYNTWTGVGAVELAWREPANTGNTPLTSYEIHIETKGNNIFRPFLKGLDPLSVSTVIYFLQENQQYNFKVIAMNAVGKGPASIPSNEIRTIKTNANRDNLVENFSLQSVSSDSIKVKWEMPLRRTNNLKGYKIMYRNEDMNELPKEKIIDDYTMLETTIDELDGGSMYSVQIQSNTKTPINLIVSTVKTTQTLNQKPSAPAECTARRETASRIVVSWNEPENPHGKILFYTIYYSNRWNPADGPYVHNVTDAQTTSKAITLGDDSADYFVEITASNSAGEGIPFECIADGKTMNVIWFMTWWFYLIVALVGACILGLLILCVILCYRRRADKGPKMQKIPPTGAAKKDDFRGPNAQVYSPNTARSYNPPPANPMNTFSGGAMGSPDQGKFGGGAGDFRYGTQPKSPDYGAPDYGYNPNKFNTFDSKATYNDPPKPSYSGFDPPSYYDPPKAAYDPPKAAFEPPQSPKGGYGGQYDQGSNFDNTSRYEQNTMDSRYRGDSASRGYPTNDRNPSYGGGGGGNFKSSQL